MVKAILKVDGPARRTQLQSRRYLVLDNDEDDFQEGYNDNEAGPSGTANNTVQ
jgi:hypothetical protein